MTTNTAGFRGWIGVARQDITPPTGIYARNWGAATHDTAEGVHLPLTATALTLQENAGSEPLVLLSLDLGWWRSSRDEWFVRGFLLEALGLDEARVMIHLTHTHAGPVLSRDAAEQPGGEFIIPYFERLREVIVQIVQQALATATASVLDWGYGKCNLARNRDLPEPGTSRTLCGFNPALPADDTLLVGRVTSITGELLATVVNYACHPTTLGAQNRLLSPDFVGTLRTTVEAHAASGTGREIPCLYLHGAAGELAPREQYTADMRIAEAHGRELGYATLSVLAGMLPPQTRLGYAGAEESGAPLAIWQRKDVPCSSQLFATRLEVTFPLQSLPTLSELDAQIRVSQNRVLTERLKRKRLIREGIGSGTNAQMPVWIWKVGNAFLLGQPNEAYSLLQTELRRRFPNTSLSIMNVVNGHFGYLPPSGLYGQDIYAVWQSPFGRGSLETLLEMCSDAIAHLSHSH